MNKFRRPKRGLNRVKKLALKRAVEEIRAKYGERAITKGWRAPDGIWKTEEAATLTMAIEAWEEIR